MRTEITEVHRELDYGYRKYLNETASAKPKKGNKPKKAVKAQKGEKAGKPSKAKDGVKPGLKK